MKTVTNYAEKKAKQFLNLLQGYTKGIRLTAILILLLMGVNNAWAHNYGGSNVYYYFANTGSWPGVHLYIWNGSWNQDFTLTKIANTNVYYHKWSSAYNNNEGILFRGAANWNNGQTNDIKASYTSHTSWVHNSTTGKTDLSNINRQAKVVAMLSTGGDYTATANANCTATVSGYTVEKGKSTATSKSASTSGSANNASISAAYGSTITYTATAGTGYTFKGFSTSNSTTLPASLDASGKTATASKYGATNNTTYYAYFKANQYTVKFDANGGTGSMSDQSHTYSVSQALTPNAFTRAGYTFEGWNTNADGTGTSYTDKQSVSNLSSTDGATITLYAQWAEIPANNHNITYTAQATGWTYGAQPTSAAEGATVTFEVIPTTGYTVTVTSSDVSLSKNGNIYTFTMPTKDVTINVSATENTHDVTISYKCDDQTIQANGTATAVGEVTAKEITAPEITGYKFTSWTLGNGITNKSANITTNPINITTKASGTYTLTANYEKVVTVYFVNSSKWSTVTCHHWVSKDNPAGTTWPGDQLTPTGETVNEFDVYKATFTNAHTMCIFNNNGGGLQTENLEVQDGKYYYLLKNQWYDSLNDIPAIDPLATEVYLAGDMNGWSTIANEFRRAAKEDTNASIIVNLTEGTYTFKIIDNGTWLGNTGTMTRNNCSGWTFEKLDGGDETNCKIFADIAGDYTFTWAINTKKLSVSYPTIYAITATANDAAMGTIAGVGEYGKGSTATLTATPNDGYLFVNWTKGGEVVATTQEYSFTVTAAVELVANFEAAPEEVHNVTVSYVCGGDTIAEDQTVAAVGVTTAKTVEAPEIWGYTFSSWTLGKDVTSANELTSNTIDINIVAGGSDFTLTANYTEIPKVTIYFVNNKKWSKVYAYGWGGSVGENPAWPGQDITANKEAEQIVGFDVYSYSVVPGSYDNIIFNKGEGGDGNQTETFKWTDGKYYYMGAADQYVGGTKDEVTTTLEDEVLATNVYLAGDMTNWGEGQLQFRKKAAGDAVATVSVELTEGEHKFKIIEDGKWLGNNGTMTREYHENWIFRAKQDDGTNDEVDATIYADENGIYTFTWNSTDNKLTVTYPAPTEKYIYFKNNPGWNKVYVYFFQEDNFNDKGAISTGLTVATKRVGEMTQVGSSDIWQYEYGTAGLPLSGVIAFTETLQENKSNFSNTKAAYRTDFNKNMELFIPQKTSNETKNGTKYYSSGLWMKYNSTESGYFFANNIDDEWNEESLVADAPGGYHFATQVSLSENTTYNFKIKNIKDDWFGQKSTTMTSTNTNVELEVGAGDEYNVQLTTTSPGFYIISIDLAAGKMMVNIEYPLLTGDYRMVYVERLGQEYTKFHPAQSIRYQAEGEKKDTISFYINKSNNPAILLQQCTNINGDTITWTDVAIQNINGIGGAAPVAALAPAKRAGELYIGTGSVDVTKNGVYNFTLGQTGGNATILNEETHPYTGDYYIRTNAADGGWRKYNTNPDNIMTHSQTALKQVGGYDYYFCKWVLKDQSVQYVVANDYSYCVSDTLTTDSIVTNVNGILPANANVRYTWNSSTNELARAYLAGSGNIADRYLVLVGDSTLKDLEGQAFNIFGLDSNEVNFKDMGNWQYQLDVKANPHTQVTLTADYNEKTQYFIGSADTTKQLIKGTDITHYALRLIYDFKTNYLVSGLVGNQTITGDLELEEVMIVRSHHDEAQTLKISNGSVTANKAYGVMTFNKDTLNDNKKSQHERALYWVSFPFDVQLDKVFGFGNYGEHWIMEYYDGAERAEKGLWKEPTYSYWKFIEDPKGYILEAGQGYVLCLDLDLLGNNAEFWKHDNTEIALYFPSSEENPIVINNAATKRETIVPEHRCTIERDDRKTKDSNWNIIGVPAYTKIAEMVGENIFYYQYNAAKDSFALSNTHNFNTMHAYMVQYADTINWTEQATSIAALAARKSPTSKDQYTLRLALQQEDAQCDHTFIRLQEDKATAEFDMNYDLCKIINRGANIYSMINNVEVAANVLPMEERVIPIGLDIHETGNYTFAMPDGTDGITAILIDYETGKETNLLLADYTTELREGTNNGRFALRVRPNHVATEVETIIDGANGQIQKYIINGALYILNNGQLYDAQGRMVQP